MNKLAFLEGYMEKRSSKFDKIIQGIPNKDLFKNKMINDFLDIVDRLPEEVVSKLSKAQLDQIRKGENPNLSGLGIQFYRSPADGSLQALLDALKDVNIRSSTVHNQLRPALKLGKDFDGPFDTKNPELIRAIREHLREGTLYDGSQGPHFSFKDSDGKWSSHSLKPGKGHKAVNPIHNDINFNTRRGERGQGFGISPLSELV